MAPYAETRPDAIVNFDVRSPAARAGPPTAQRLADFDVLAQLAEAGGELRMTELAGRTLVPRSGLTCRVARLVDEGLVRRANATGDGRGVVVALTDAGVVRMTETVPGHLLGVSKLFVERLDDQELAVLETALRKVIVDSCATGTSLLVRLFA